eukprot:3884670-Rhodomonas_salina.1
MQRSAREHLDDMKRFYKTDEGKTEAGPAVFNAEVSAYMAGAQTANAYQGNGQPRGRGMPRGRGGPWGRGGPTMSRGGPMMGRGGPMMGRGQAGPSRGGQMGRGGQMRSQWVQGGLRMRGGPT